MKLYCRICHNSEVDKFHYDHPVFRGKQENWQNIFCKKCLGVSHFNFKDKIDYKLDYRKKSGEIDNVSPPFDPWSEVSFHRHVHVKRVLKNNNLEFDKILDLGGYNGFTAYGLKKANTKITIADYDPKGLNIAKSLGFNIINLSKKEPDFGDYNLITLLHVVEHLENPKDFISNIASKIKDDTAIYIEVPNLYGFPMYDPAHLTSFSKNSLISLINSSGLSIIETGFTKSPDIVIKHQYFFSNKLEVIYILAKKVDKSSSFSRINNKAVSLTLFKLKLDLIYNWIVIRYVLINIIKVVLKNSFRLFSYALSMVFSVSIFKFIPIKFGILIKKIAKFGGVKL
jgi:hypothetical protein